MYKFSSLSRVEILAEAQIAVILQTMCSKVQQCMYCLFGVNKIIFSIFIFYAWFGMLLKGTGESFLLSKDEPLTSKIDGVMALWIFRRRTQTAKNRRTLDL